MMFQKNQVQRPDFFLPELAIQLMEERITHIELPQGKKVFFASDFHLGAPSREQSVSREKKVVRWLSEIEQEAAHVFILGDIFDFWFEYRYTIPKGFARLQGKLMEMRDNHIPLTFFTGNHDKWMFSYFENDFGISIFRQPVSVRIGDRDFLIGHGDGLGPGDKTYKLIKKVFENRMAQWLFGWIHPTIGFKLAHYWSGKSRESNLQKDQEFLGEEEWLLQYCRETEKKGHHDYYIFGHRHLPLAVEINPESRYINLGDWINTCTYAVYDGDQVKLKEYEG